MNLLRLAARLLLGRRLPIATGEHTVAGLDQSLTIRRDRWGVPHIDAASDADAWFGLGFCHAQDRGFQLETLLRVGRGAMAELVGPSGLSIDRLSRRIGFHRSARAQVEVLDPQAVAGLTAYVAGINAGFIDGLSTKPHEFAILGGEPTPWTPADVLAFLKFSTFMLPSNWDVEMARLRVLLADGPEAVRNLDPISILPNALSQLEEDLAALRELVPSGGGSNAWVIAGSRTLSGKPLLASDPHLAPTVPAPWYLAHLRGPDWAVAGATFVGAPAFPIGHNGHSCWGVTAGLTDVSDWFLETIGPDGRSVQETDGSFTACSLIRETIAVKGQEAVVEEVLLSPRGPIVIRESGHALALRAVWLEPLPMRGFLDAFRARDFESFRLCFREWPVMPLNLLYADADGTIGYQLVGQLPQRKSGYGLLPRWGRDPASQWEADLVPFEAMPFAVNPEAGFLATANDDPRTFAPGDAHLGYDFVDPYRADVIREELARHPVGWAAIDCQKLQRNERSKPWQEIRETILALVPADPAAREALELLRSWDGQVSADSSGAAVFELLVAELSVRVAKAKAHNSWMSTIGETGISASGHNLFADRRVGHLVHLLREQPPGWFDRGWPAEIEDALGSVIRRLRHDSGPGSRWWQWGDLRPLVLRNPVLGKLRGIGRLFRIGPVPIGGDQNTVSQAGVRPDDPTAPTHNFANLRVVFDTENWANSRFILAGGQSGNPLSPHFDDQFALWQKGEGISLGWTTEAVLRDTVASLRLKPSVEGA